MFEKSQVLGMAAAMASHAATRISAIAQNVANADTPGYRAKDAPGFSDSYRAAGDFRLAASRAGHLTDTPGAVATAISDRKGGHLSPNGNNVSLEDEMMRASAARQDHDMALSIYKSSLNILRASLGRR